MSNGYRAGPAFGVDGIHHEGLALSAFISVYQRLNGFLAGQIMVVSVRRLRVRQFDG